MGKKKGINYHRLMVLYIIYKSDFCTQKQIMSMYDIAKQTINNIINSLVKKGLVTLDSNEKHHKEKLIQYTEKGIQYAENILHPLLSTEDAVAEKWEKK